MNSSQNITEKICTQCNILLPLTDFYLDRTAITKVSYRSKCKKCCKINQNNRKKIDIDTSIKFKICSICKENLSIDKFCISYRHTDGYFSECYTCLKNKRKNVGNNPKFKRTKEYMIEYNANKYKQIEYKVKHSLRKSLSYYLSKSENNKNDKTLNYVGCTVEFLIDWFEYLFDDKMTLENHGKYWHIDHIIPCASFNLKDDEEIYKCYNWSNLRPCEGKENIIKSNKNDEELINKYNDLKIKFLDSINFNINNNVYSSATCG
jgi:hypothetical protein